MESNNIQIVEEELKNQIMEFDDDLEIDLE